VARFYADENFPLLVVEMLRQLGHDVLTTAEAGTAGRGIPDEEVLAFATGQNRILITLNRRHFVKLHQTQPRHSGIMTCTYDPDAAGQARRIHEVIAGSGHVGGKLIRVNRPST
jgi:predicted nuclease of predicted toxin-antitoxin system